MTVADEKDLPYRDSSADGSQDTEVIILPKDSVGLEYDTVNSECFKESKLSNLIAHLPSMLLMNEMHIINQESSLFQSIKNLQTSNDLKN